MGINGCRSPTLVQLRASAIRWRRTVSSPSSSVVIASEALAGAQGGLRWREQADEIGGTLGGQGVYGLARAADDAGETVAAYGNVRWPFGD